MNCRRCGQLLFTQPSLTALISLRPLVKATLCNQCRQAFDRIDQAHCCQDCGRAGVDGRCRDCMRWRKLDEPVLQNRGLFTYNDAMKDWIERYKGIGDYNLRDSFASDIVQFMQMRGCAFVPLTTEAGHFAERGFDPVLGLFAPLPLREWLVKDNTQMPQAKKNRAARLKTPQSFRCVATKEEMAKFDRICLLDDLYTTGRTLHHAAAAILAAGYKGKVISRSLIR